MKAKSSTKSNALKMLGGVLAILFFAVCINLGWDYGKEFAEHHQSSTN